MRPLCESFVLCEPAHSLLAAKGSGIRNPPRAPDADMSRNASADANAGRTRKNRSRIMTAKTTYLMAAFAGLVTVCSGAATPRDARAGDLGLALNAPPEPAQWQSRLLVNEGAPSNPDPASAEWESAVHWKSAPKREITVGASAADGSTQLRTQSARGPMRDSSGPRRSAAASAR